MLFNHQSRNTFFSRVFLAAKITDFRTFKLIFISNCMCMCVCVRTGACMRACMGVHFCLYLPSAHRPLGGP